MITPAVQRVLDAWARLDGWADDFDRESLPVFLHSAMDALAAEAAAATFTFDDAEPPEPYEFAAFLRDPAGHIVAMIDANATHVALSTYGADPDDYRTVALPIDRPIADAVERLIEALNKEVEAP